MADSTVPADDTAQNGAPPQTLGEIGLGHFAPYLMNSIMGRYNQRLQDRLGAEGQSIAKMRTLAVLSVVDGLMTNELAVYAVIEQSTLSRTLDVMEAEALIRRRPGARDSRVRYIHITEKGRQLFRQVWPGVAETYRDLFAGIPADEHLRFVGTLRKILRNIRKHDF